MVAISMVSPKFHNYLETRLILLELGAFSIRFAPLVCRDEIFDLDA